MFENLRLEMYKRRMSTDDLAKILGISGAAMRNKLAGRNEFKLSEIQKIVEVFGMDFGQEWKFWFERTESRAG